MPPPILETVRSVGSPARSQPPEVAVLAVVAIMVILLAWGLVAGRLARWSITAPIAMVLAGLLLTAGANPVFVIDLDTSAVEHTVEVVLAVLLFVDATEVRGGLFGGRPTLTARLLLIALPLSLAAAVVIGAFGVPRPELLAVGRDGLRRHPHRPRAGRRGDPRPAGAGVAASAAQRRERVQRRGRRADLPVLHHRRPHPGR